MGQEQSVTSPTGAKRGATGRLGGLRRRLMLLAGLGAAAVAQATTDPPKTARAAGFVVGAPPGYSPIDSQTDGVQGYAVGAGNSGTLGRNNDLNGVGVYGVAPNGVGSFGLSTSGTGAGGQSTSGTGMVGRSSSGIGVLGESDSNTGVFGNSLGAQGVWGNAASGTGVRATSTSGVGGHGTSSSSFGLAGNSVSSYGVYGYSVHGHGVVGRSDQPSGGIGVYGLTSASGAVGVHGVSDLGTGVWGVGLYHGVRGSSSGAGYAGQFDGPVLISGSLNVTGAKSALVPQQDGSHRRLYCVESPDSVFEDFGEGVLSAGRAQVQIDSGFASVVKTNDYAVFLTPEGDCRGLYVTAKTPTNFEVRELQGGVSSLQFRYRIVAMRKDIEAPRLERVQVDLTKPTAPDRPKIDAFDTPITFPPGVGAPVPDPPQVVPTPSATTSPVPTPGIQPTLIPAPREF